MEFKSGFDASPYMDAATWGKPKYKKVTDPDTSQKVYTGNGLDIHEAKKNRYKLQSESDPDVKIGYDKSTRAAVAIKRRKGSDYIPVIEVRAKVVADRRRMPGLQVARYPEQRERFAAMDGGYFDDLMAGFYARERIAQESNAKVIEEYSRARSTPTDTPEYTYKVFRLLSSDLVEHAKRQGLTPAEFYRKHNAELYRIANDAASQTGVEREQFAAYIREHAPKLADAIAGKSDTPKTSEATEPDSLEALQKKLTAATRRRDKAQREIDELEVKLGVKGSCSECKRLTKHFTSRGIFTCKPCEENSIAMGVPGFEPDKTVEEVRHEFYQDMSAIDREVEAKPERSSPMRKSKKQQQREARREKRRAKRSGKRSGKTSERMAA